MYQEATGGGGFDLLDRTSPKPISHHWAMFLEVAGDVQTLGSSDFRFLMSLLRLWIMPIKSLKIHMLHMAHYKTC